MTIRRIMCSSCPYLQPFYETPMGVAVTTPSKYIDDSTTLKRCALSNTTWKAHHCVRAPQQRISKATRTYLSFSRHRSPHNVPSCLVLVHHAELSRLRNQTPRCICTHHDGSCGGQQASTSNVADAEPTRGRLGSPDGEHLRRQHPGSLVFLSHREPFLNTMPTETTVKAKRRTAIFMVGGTYTASRLTQQT